MFAYVCMSVSLMTELTAQQQQLLEDAQSESVPEGVYPAAGRASPCASLPSLAAGLAAAEPQPPSAFPTGSTRGGPADPRQQDLLCTRMLLSTQLIQLSLMVFWRAADLLARAGAGDGGPRALLLPAPAGLRGDRQLVALPCLDTVHQRSPPWEAPQPQLHAVVLSWAATTCGGRAAPARSKPSAAKHPPFAAQLPVTPPTHLLSIYRHKSSAYHKKRFSFASQTCKLLYSSPRL